MVPDEPLLEDPLLGERWEPWAFSGRGFLGPFWVAAWGSILRSDDAAMASASAMRVGFVRPATVIPTTIAPCGTGRGGRRRTGRQLTGPPWSGRSPHHRSWRPSTRPRPGEAVVSACREDANCSAACWRCGLGDQALDLNRAICEVLGGLIAHEVSLVDDDARTGSAARSFPGTNWKPGRRSPAIGETALGSAERSWSVRDSLAV